MRAVVANKAHPRGVLYGEKLPQPAPAHAQAGQRAAKVPKKAGLFMAPDFRK
jgi:hypothetical protein